jgi:hypothetical protein
MKRLFLLAVLTLFFLGATSLQAQTSTFAYSSIQSNNCSPITEWKNGTEFSTHIPRIWVKCASASIPIRILGSISRGS